MAVAHLRPRSAVGKELVRDHDARRFSGGFQELPHEPLCSATVSSTLDQDVENEAILIDGNPLRDFVADNCFGLDAHFSLGASWSFVEALRSRS
jgi:hypothetical protein